MTSDERSSFWIGFECACSLQDFRNNKWCECNVFGTNRFNEFSRCKTCAVSVEVNPYGRINEDHDRRRVRPCSHSRR